MKGIAPLAALAVIGLLTIILIGSGVVKLPAELTGGFSTLSLSQVQYLSNDPELGGSAWLLTIIADGGGQQAKGIFKSTEISDSGKTAQKGFILEVNMLNDTVEYVIRNDYQYLYKVEYADIGFQLDSKGACKSKGFDYGWVKPSNTFSTFCFKTTAQGVMGTIEPAKESFAAEIKLTREDGNVQKTIINNVDATSASLGNDIRIRWVGSLSTGDFPPSPEGQGVAALYGSDIFGTVSKWKIVSKSAFVDWQSSLANLISCASGNPEAPKICTNNVNSKMSAVILGRNFISSGGAIATTIGTVNDGKVIINLNKQLSNPIITLKIRASYLGIYETTCKPEIVEPINEITFRTGTEGLFKVSIRNAGDASCNVDVSVNCVSPLSSSDRTRISIPVGKTIDAYLRVTGVASGTESKKASCTFTAKDLAKSENVDIAIGYATVTGIALCEEGQKRTVGPLIQECKNGGWVTIQDCGNLAADPITFKCIETANGKKIDIFKNLGIFFGNLVGGMIISGIVIGVIILIGMLFGLPFIKMVIKNISLLIVAIIIIGLVIAFGFTNWSATIAQMVIG